MATLETGAGASTIVLAATGAQHAAITPAADEIARIRAECERLDVRLDSVTFHLGPSEDVLPRLPRLLLDVALIGGADGFPYPVLDWWHIAPRLRVGGYLLVDTAYNPAAAAVVEHLRRDAAWRYHGALGYTTVLAEKLADTPPRALFAGDRAIGRLSFRHLPPTGRARASARHAIFTTRAGLASVAWARTHLPWLWRRAARGSRS